jgi:hypothetical protein
MDFSRLLFEHHFHGPTSMLRKMKAITIISSILQINGVSFRSEHIIQISSHALIFERREA